MVLRCRDAVQYACHEAIEDMRSMHYGFVTKLEGFGLHPLCGVFSNSSLVDRFALNEILFPRKVKRKALQFFVHFYEVLVESRAIAHEE